MLELPNVTVICVDCIETRRALKSINLTIKDINFGDVKFLTSLQVEQPIDRIKIIPIPIIRSKIEYSCFIIKELYKYIETSHVLIVQWDAYVINPQAWTNEFLEYDYIGAPWHFRTDFKVGNGGFSLRSKKLLELTATLPEIIRTHPEDDTVCIIYRQLLINNGIKFAPIDLAYKFAVENEIHTGQFGYHGGASPKKV